MGDGDGVGFGTGTGGVAVDRCGAGPRRVGLDRYGCGFELGAGVG